MTYDSDTEKLSKAELYRKYALAFIADYRTVYHGGCIYNYHGNHYRLETEPTVAIRQWFQQKRIGTTSTTVNNTLDEVKGYCRRYDGKAFPFWTVDENRPDPKSLIPFRNGMLSIPDYLAGNYNMLPHTPNYVSLYCLPFDFNPDAVCPQWLAFLESSLSAEGIALLQEWFGYCLTPDVSLQKFLLMVGLPRSGKGTISSILRALVGDINTAAFSMSRLIDRFSLSALATAQVALVGEVELAPNEAKKILERFKEITGNDPQTIERKGVDIKDSIVLPTRFCISANQMPHFRDDSGALAARMLIVRFCNTFVDREDTTLLERLRTELPGIAIWALAGLKRLRANGWTQSEEMIAEKKSYRRDSSTALAFLQDRCLLRHDWLTPLTPDVETTDNLMCYTTMTDLGKSFTEWSGFHDQRAEFNWVCRNLRSLLPNMPTTPPKMRQNDKLIRYMPGIKLKDIADAVDVN